MTDHWSTATTNEARLVGLAAVARAAVDEHRDDVAAYAPLIIDLSDDSKIGVEGVKMLMALIHPRHLSGTAVRIICPQHTDRHFLALTGVDRFAEVLDVS